MPPETFAWDRKEFFRDRKHERLSEPHHHSHPHSHPYPYQHQLSRGGGYGGAINGGGSRWREQQHLLPNPHPSPRWVSDGRGRPASPGYGRQGGRHFHPEEEGHGLVPFRSNDKSSVDESFRASGSGKFSRSNRESRPSFGQKEWKGRYLEAVPSPSGYGRLNALTDQPKLGDDMPTSSSSNDHAVLADLHDQSLLQDMHDKNDSVNGTVSDSLKSERDNLSGSVDWKSIKWTRSGSLHSRGSGLSQSNSSRSMGIDSNDTKDEVQQTNVSPIQSSSCDAANGIGVFPAAFESLASPYEETSSRKKPRLGWGEGLAKYEKKKVEGIEDCETRNGSVSCGSNAEQLHVDSSNSAVENHTVNALSDFATPALSTACSATPAPSSAVCFSCSPGVEEKQFIKAVGFDHDKSNLSVLSGIVSHNDAGGSAFNLENMDLDSIACLNSAINKLRQSDVQSLGDSGFVRSTAMNKLLVWKGDVLKALEITESEIDKLEGELKTLTELEVSCLQQSASSSLSSSYCSRPGNHDSASDISHQPAPLSIILDGDSDVHKMPNSVELQQINGKSEDVESPGSATSKLVEVPFSRKDVSSCKQYNHVQSSSKLEINASAVSDAECSTKRVNDLVKYDGFQIVASGFSPYSGDSKLLFDVEDKLHGSIWASNRETANGAAEELSKLLLNNQSTFDIRTATGVPCVERSEIIKAKLLRRKYFQQFKERLIALKFRVLQHSWKEDVRLLSLKKFRVKSQKKLDHSLRNLQSGHRKYHLSVHAQIFSPVGKLSLAPNVKMVKFVRKLISDSQPKPLRNALKMPALILDKKEKMVRRFVSSNGMVADPLAVEKERSMINFWTEEEREIFMDALAAYGKDFTKISSFLTHKTTADCIEFYYKNHKSDFFKRAKKHPSSAKQGKTFPTNNYLVTSGKRLICEANAASLDILGAASVIAANAEDCVEIRQKLASKHTLATQSKISSGSSWLLEKSSSLDLDDNERETVAADVLAGICSSLSSEAMGSCITSAIDPGEGYHERKYQRICSSSRWRMEPEVTQDVDETCSDDSCRETDPTDWTDEEKSVFIRSVSSNGLDFAMISRCVRTRSRDQCKIFFSKARKCLALDAICPGSTHVLRTGVNIAGNDVANVCAEADSGAFDEMPMLNMEVDLPSDSKLNTEPDAGHLSNAEPALNRLEINDATSVLEPIDTKSQPGSLISVHIEKLDQGVDGEDQMCQSCKAVAVQDEGASVISSGLEAVPRIGGASNLCDIPDSQAVNKLPTSDLMEQGPMLWEMKMNCTSKKDDANISEITHSCNNENAKLNLHVVDDDNTQAADKPHSGGCGLPGNLQKVGSEPDFSEKPCVITLQQNNYSVPVKLVSQLSTAAEQGTSKEGTTVAIGVGSIGGQQDGHPSRPREQLHSECSLLGSVECQMLKGYATPDANSRELNGKNSCVKRVGHQSIQSVNKNSLHDLHLVRDGLLQKCNGTKQLGSTAEHPFHSLDLTRNTYSQLDVSLGMEKPRQSGKVKLFGQILTKPSHQKSSPMVQQIGEGENRQGVGRSFNFRSTGDHSVVGCSSRAKLDCSHTRGTENAQVTSYGFWDGSRIQTGFSSLPNSAVSMAKYPSGFGNNSVPSKKLQLPSRGVNGGSRNLNGLSIFPVRAFGSSNGTADYPVRSTDTWPLQQRQELLLSEMQRRNGFEAVPVVQQAARGIVGINGGLGGIVVGGQCSGVSEPVAAVRMHYAHAEQFNGQAASVIAKDELWRGQGNVGL